jgi:hypothetical protein
MDFSLKIFPIHCLILANSNMVLICEY